MQKEKSMAESLQLTTDVLDKSVSNVMTSIADADLVCLPCNFCAAFSRGTNREAGSVCTCGCLGLGVIDAPSETCGAAGDLSMPLAIAAKTGTACGAFTCWSAAVLPLHKEEGSSHCRAEGNSADVLMTVGCCWRVSVQCCCFGRAQAAGLQLAAEASSEVLKAGPEAPAMLHTI